MGQPAQAQPRHVISINMCLDQLLIDLADRAKIMGLSPFARDPVRSWAAVRAKDLPVLSGTAEEIIMRRPDLVLADGYSRSATLQLIRAQNIPVEIFKPVTTIDEAKRQIARMGELLEAHALAQSRIEAIDAALARLRAAALQGGLRVLPLSRRGWVEGRDTLLSGLLAAGGLKNAAAEAGFAAGGFISLEMIVTLRPDAIVISRDDSEAEDQGRAFLLHPALETLFPPERRIILPEQLTICGGPMLVEAMDELSRQLKKIKSRPAAR